MNWSDVEKAAPGGLKLLGTALAMTGVGAPVGALVGGLGAIIGHVIGAPPTPDNVSLAMADPTLQEKLMEVQDNNATELQKLVLQKAIADGATETQQQSAVLADKQSARVRDEALIAAGKTNIRADVMLVGAYLSVGAIVLSLCIGHIDPGGAIFALLLMLATKFAGNIGTAFDFEFGSSRGSVDKTAVLTTQAQGAIDTAAKVAATLAAKIP